MSHTSSKNVSGFLESQLLRDSLTEAINRYENFTNTEKAPDRQTFADRKQVGAEINEQVIQIVKLDMEVKSMPGFTDVVHEPKIVSAYELNAILIEEDAKVPSTQSIGRFVQSFTPPQPPPSKFKCSLCDKQFEKLWVVKRHMKEHAELLEKFILPVQI